MDSLIDDWPHLDAWALSERGRVVFVNARSCSMPAAQSLMTSPPTAAWHRLCRRDRHAAEPTPAATTAGEGTRIGQMTGAKILISGSVISVDKKTILVARIVGTETTRVFAASVDGKAADELAPLVEKLAEQIADTIAKKGDQLVAKIAPKPDRIAAVKLKLKGERPVLWVKITERHIAPEGWIRPRKPRWPNSPGKPASGGRAAGPPLRARGRPAGRQSNGGWQGPPCGGVLIAGTE